MTALQSVDQTNKFFEALQNDFKNLCLESKKRYHHVKEGCEDAAIKVRNFSVSPKQPLHILAHQIYHPLVLACETREFKLIKIAIGAFQKLILAEAVDERGVKIVLETLWNLMESSSEEVKVLQTSTLLLTTSSVVRGDDLSKALVLCFRLHFTKDPITVNAASATVRQLVSLVFERVVIEDQESLDDSTERDLNIEELKTPTGTAPHSLMRSAADAYLMFQDLVQLVNADQPYWLHGLTEMTKTFGLELLESVLTNFSSVFYKHPEFTFLLKERVCALVIKLFSPNIKYRAGMTAGTQQSAAQDKPYFPISVRLLRVVATLVQRYYSLLITQCEIFLSLMIKFLDQDKPNWQRALALEVLQRLCVQSELLAVFCRSYDMKPHSTKILQDILNALGFYVQALFVTQQSPASVTYSGQPPALISGMPIGPGVSPQPGFYYRGIWLPLLQPGPIKCSYLDCLDKLDAPSIPDGYGITVAYNCLIDIQKSLTLIIEGTNSSNEELNNIPYNPSSEEKELHCQLLNSTWCGLLSALSLLLEACTDEAACEKILRMMQSFASLCGKTGLTGPRDAFIIAICKASLPPHYALTVFNTPVSLLNTISNQSQPSVCQEGSNVPLGQYLGHENEPRPQVVVVGTPLPTASLPIGAQQGPVMLTSKNLQSMRAILNIAHFHGSILGSSWHLLLTTLQHLVWVLGLKPSTGGSLKAGKTNTDTNAVITTAVMTDLPVLSSMLSRLFESSQYIDDVALHHLIDALCKLSQEAMDLAYSNREPSLFAVAKLLETGIVNLVRIEVFWRPMTNHLLEICQHPHVKMREWGVEAVTYLVKMALQFPHTTPLKDNQRLQILLLSPLQELSSITHADVRQKQLDSILQILHSSGETLSYGWPLVVTMIGAVNDNQSENLIRTAFQCLQLVVTDFLPVMPWSCLPLVVDTAGKFGGQAQELNISLTAIGLMWNISDYFFQNQDKIRQFLSEDGELFPEFPGVPNMPPFDKLWMCLYARLGDLCVDIRPAVRKSAGQTLFSTISAHGHLLQNSTWQAVIWQVLFPLLDKVYALSATASCEKVDMAENILIHHSRNTAQKQWAETQVLTLTGVSRVFGVKRKVLKKLGDFPRAWALLLEFIESAALSKSSEVSLAALKAFQEILSSGKTTSEETQECEKEEGSLEEVDSHSEMGSLWANAWKVWYHIGTESTQPPKEVYKEEVIYVPNQPFLAALVQIFPFLFSHIKDRFQETDLQKLGNVLRNAVSVPIRGEASPFVLPSLTEAELTPLQEWILHCLELIITETETGEEKWMSMIPSLFGYLLEFSQYSCLPPCYGQMDVKPVAQVKSMVKTDWLGVNYVPFAEKSLNIVLALYRKTASHPTVVDSSVLGSIVQALDVPLGMKYNCPSQSSWHLAVTVLVSILNVGLPLARATPEKYEGMWTMLATTLENFLFSKSTPPSSKSLEEIRSDEAVDCQIICLVRDEILPYSDMIPNEFIMKIMVLLNRGSIHSASTRNIFASDADLSTKLREDFAKTCFETLLQFSLLNNNANMDCLMGTSPLGNGNGDNSTVTSKLAVTSLLHRFEEVLKEYVSDEKLSGKCPLPRNRLAEISFVLKAISTLISSLKKAAPEKVDSCTWNRLIGLYPHLVDCTTTTSAQVARSLQEALYQYKDLLSPPKHVTNGV